MLSRASFTSTSSLSMVDIKIRWKSSGVEVSNLSISRCTLSLTRMVMDTITPKRP